MDLSNEGLSLCASLMLAQAQALVYEKAVKDKLNRGLLSKLGEPISNSPAVISVHSTLRRFF